jgi:hypothetical protein
VVYWDADGLKDLLIGQADGRVRLFTNIGTDAAPTFDGGTFLQVGPGGSKTNIDVGSRATLEVVDWNSDGTRDLIVGAIDGKIHVFINEGTDTSPDFVSEILAQENGSDLIVPSVRSSPRMFDLDGDGAKDLLTGNTNGEILFYANVGSDAAPSFYGYSYVDADGVIIDLNSLGRSRSYLCDWTGDDKLDLLVGVGDGQVHLYQGKTYVPVVSEWGLIAMAMLLVAGGVLTFLRRRRSVG